MSTRQFCIIHFLCFATILGAAQEGEKTVSTLISGFDSAKDIAAWKTAVKSVSTALNQRKAFIASGTGSFQVKFPSSANGGPRWPAVTLQGKALFPKDWNIYHELVCELFNPDKEKRNIYIIIKTGKGLSATQSFNLVPGWQTLRWKLPGAVIKEPVHTLEFFRNDPSEAATFYLDELRLETDLNTLIQTSSELKKQLQSPLLTARAKKAGLSKECASLQAALKTLSPGNNNSAVLKYAKSLLKLKNDTETFFRQLNTRQDKNAAAAFMRKFPKSPWGYGWIHSAAHVYRSGIPFQGYTGGIPAIRLARNETEAIQLVLRSRKTIKNVRISTGPLINKKNNATLPQSAVKIAPVGFVQPMPAPYPHEKIKWRPDPLLDNLKAFQLDPDVWQPIWLEIKTGRSTMPGTYHGTITVTGDNVPAINIPFAVTVWNFELPERLTMPAAFTYGGLDRHIYAKNNKEWTEFESWKTGQKSVDELSPGGKRLCNIELTTEDLLLAHRITPSNLYLSTRAHTVKEVRRWIEKGGGPFNIFYVQSVPSIKKGEPYPPGIRKWLLSVIDAAVQEFKKADLLQYAYIYAFDEMEENQFAAARDILTEVKKRWPDIPIVTTAFDPSYGKDSGLADLVDIWVPLAPKLEKEQKAIQEARQRGAKIWSYTCMYTPEANFLLEQPASAPRLLTGIMQYKYNSDGFLYYHTNYWQRSPVLKGGPLTNHTGRSAYQSFNGDGMLLYPGADGPLPTIRLKGIRDGLEDHEYFLLLERLEGLTAEERLERDKLLKIPETVVFSMREYDKTGDKLIDYRQKIGEFLDKHVHKK